jgi:hypothetical protein
MELFIVMGVLPIILLILGFPIFVILMVSSVITILFIMDLPITMVQIELFGSVDNYKLIAVPFFIFAGAIMAQGGISRRLVDWVVSLLGAVRGSLALTTVGACTIFGAISGSSPATVAAVGGMLFPSLREKGYPERFASGLLASSGAIAGIIPPSIAMILYGAAAEESVRHLFIAGVFPGLFVAFVMGATNFFTTTKSITLIESGMIPSVIFVSKRWMKKLPKNLQGLVIKTGRDTEIFAAKFAANANKKAEALWKKNGAEVIRLPAADQAEINKRLAPLGDEFLGANPKASKMYGILKDVLKTASTKAP